MNVYRNTAISDLYLSENQIFELPETIGIEIKEVPVGLNFFIRFNCFRSFILINNFEIRCK